MAPSPTGFFHVGSARTALFNYLFARHHNGAFVLRIEDTDQSRGSDEYERIIYDALAWLGLDFDEGPQQGGEYGPYRQSERTEIYQKYAQQLLESGAAYKAYETPEELAAMKEEQAKQKLPPRYNGAHRDLSDEQRAAFEAEGRRAVVRLRVPENETVAWPDATRGAQSWNSKDLDDFVICKSDGGPTYNFACAVDDALMKISHVIRGEDGLSNTPRQILILKALGFEVPIYAHLPFLLGKDRSKLSKRHGTVSLLDFDKQGIPADAMFNYLALLGWNPGGGDTQEIFSREELIEKFSLEGVNKSGAIFDEEKLSWLNIQRLKALPLDEFIALARPYLDPIPGFAEALHDDPAYAHAAIELSRDRIHGIADIGDAARAFFTDDYPLDETGVAKHLTETSRPRLQQLHDSFVAIEEWTHENLDVALRALAAELGIKPAELIHPSRMAVSGRTVGPSIFHLLEALGRERVLRRLERAAKG
jgi:glutamyl-tRNA synthetase